MTLRTPEPDHFRKQVGRYGDRFYIDALDLDDEFGPTQQEFPSVSIIKGVFPKYLGAWYTSVTAEYAYDTKDAWKDLPKDEAVELIKHSPTRSRNRAAARGTAIHTVIETLSMGGEVDWRLVEDGVLPFRDTIHRLVDELQPVPLFAETVVVNRTVGYSGTFDFLGNTSVGLILADWKTRAKYYSYDEEAAQVAAYARAEYALVEVNGMIKRERLPQIDGGAVVVITPMGYRIMRVDIEASFKLWKTMVAFWLAMKNTTPYAGVLVPPAYSMESRMTSIRERINAMPPIVREKLAAQWPPGLPTLRQNPSRDQLVQIDNLVAKFESRFGLDWTIGIPKPLEDRMCEDSEYSDFMVLSRRFAHLRATGGMPSNLSYRRYLIFKAYCGLATATTSNMKKMAELAEIERLAEWSIEEALEVIEAFPISPSMPVDR